MSVLQVADRGRVFVADVDADGKVELIYDHEGCGAEKGPVYIVDPMTGTIENKIEYGGSKVPSCIISTL